MTDYRFHRFTPLRPDFSSMYEVFTYPMGDTTVRRATTHTAPAANDVQVARVHGSTVDWTVIAAWADIAYTESPACRRVLVLPYLPSARGDKDVPCPARINAQMAARTGITDLIVADPHSPVWVDQLKSTTNTVTVHVIDAVELVKAGLETRTVLTDHTGVIAPDAGARNRAEAVARELGLPLHTATKHRDPATGHLSGYSLDGDLQGGTYLVVDDIIDGGGTFALLADALPDDAVADLWVTHGGFTRPNHSRDVVSRFRQVYTTDSLPSAVAAADEYLTGIRVVPLHQAVGKRLTAIQKGSV